jgi:hypothetical protein
MDLRLSGKTALVPARARVSALPSPARWWTPGPTSWPDHAAAGLNSPRWKKAGNVTFVSADLSQPDGSQEDIRNEKLHRLLGNRRATEPDVG